jgi:hypothetical protein
MSWLQSIKKYMANKKQNSKEIQARRKISYIGYDPYANEVVHDIVIHNLKNKSFNLPTSSTITITGLALGEFNKLHLIVEYKINNVLTNPHNKTEISKIIINSILDQYNSTHQKNKALFAEDIEVDYASVLWHS